MRGETEPDRAEGGRGDYEYVLGVRYALERQAQGGGREWRGRRNGGIWKGQMESVPGGCV